MKFLWCFLILILAFISSCKKKEFPETVQDTTADFYFNGTVNGSQVSINAGKDNYYMYSSYSQDANGIYSFIGDLRQADCGNCANSLQIKINDFRISQPGGQTTIDSSLVPKYYPLTAGYRYAVQFKSIYNQTASAHFWDFGDGLRSEDVDPVHYYNAKGNYNVYLKIIGTNSCEQYIKNPEKIQFPAKNCNIVVARDSARTITCSANTPGFVPYSYLWDFGDGFKSSVPTPSHTYVVPGTRPILLRIIDTDNDTIYAKYNNATLSDPITCLTNYSVTSITPSENAQAFSNVSVSWTDAAGTVYSSNNALQPATSFFEIISVEQYDNNERGETTKKIKVRIKCNVYNGTAVKTIDNAEAVIAVSYK